ncbi:MAG: hypothetical protein JSR28_19205 [Proteobacteria bacterium]|nr:hypothetical protein [Pseudomonadota bacterium]
MSEPTNAFEVVALALCPQRDLVRFCDHYLRQGARRVQVFYDAVPDFALSDPRVQLVACDPTFWRGLGLLRPPSVEGRQRAVYRHAYVQCETEWLLVVDVDEFVFGPQPLDALLAGIGPGPDCVRFTSAEAVFAPIDNIEDEFSASAFRLPTTRLASPLLARLLYGAHSGLYVRGLLGHARGKQAVRSGLADVQIDIHDATVPGRDLDRLDATVAHGFMLAHYDAINFARWSEKCADRLRRGDAREMGRKRERQLALYAACTSKADQVRLFRRLYALDRWQMRVLALAGLLHEPQEGLFGPSADPAVADPMVQVRTRCA